MGAHGFKDICNRQYPGFRKNCVTLEPLRITTPVHSFMMLVDDFCHRQRKIDIFQYLVASLRMRSHHLHFKIV